MKRSIPASICLLLLGMCIHGGAWADSDTDFLGGLGGAFSEMGRNLKDVVKGRSHGDTSHNVVDEVDGTAADTIARSRPRGMPPTGRPLVYEIQYRLQALGYSPGKIDGLMGRKTAAAIGAYQRSIGVRVDGRPSTQLRDALRTSSPSVQLPAHLAGPPPQPDDSSSASKMFGAVADGLANALASSDSRPQSGQAGTAALAGQLHRSNTAAMTGQSNDGFALALGALAATSAGSHGTTASYQPGLIPGTSPVQGQSYLDRMAAEGDADVYRAAANIDPQTRDRARRAGVDLDRHVARQLAGYEAYKGEAAAIEHLTGTTPVPGHGMPAAAAPPAGNPASIVAALTQGQLPTTPNRALAVASNDSHLGTWTGRVTQPDGSPSRYSMTLVLSRTQDNSIVGKSTYPELSCGGPSHLIGADAGTLKWKEVIVAGRTRCVDGYVYTRLIAPGRLAWDWYYLDGKKGAWAVLTRTASAMARRPESGQGPASATVASSRPVSPLANTPPAETLVFHRDADGCFAADNSQTYQSSAERLATRIFGHSDYVRAGCITHPYLRGDYYDDQIRNLHHAGLDLRGGTADTVHSPTGGLVVAKRFAPAQGQSTLVIHDVQNAKKILFLHMSQIDVEVGDEVVPGQKLGMAGSVGAAAPHLHVEVWPSSSPHFENRDKAISGRSACPDTGGVCGLESIKQFTVDPVTHMRQ